MKRKQKVGDTSSEIATILTKYMEISEESDAKRRLMDAELEEKQREQEREHKERMTCMMLGFMQQVLGASSARPPPEHYRPPNAPAFPPHFNCLYTQFFLFFSHFTFPASRFLSLPQC